MMTCQFYKDEIAKLGVTNPGLTKKADLKAFYETVVAATPAQRQHQAETKYQVHYKSEYLPVEYTSPDPATDFQLRYLHLFERGWTVFPKPVNYNTDEIRSQMLDWFHYANPGFQPTDPATWTSTNLPTLLHGIVKAKGGHTDFQWTTRLAVKPYFEKIWGTPDLLCSFDGFNFMPPQFCKRKNKLIQVNSASSELSTSSSLNAQSGMSHGGTSAQTAPVTGTTVGWMHIDQNRLTAEMTCFQGLVHVTPSGPYDSGLLVLPYSHLYWDQYYKDSPLSGYGSFNFVDGSIPVTTPIPESSSSSNTYSSSSSSSSNTNLSVLRQAMGLQLKDHIYTKVCCQPGEFVVWNSKTFHQAGQLQSDTERLAIYVSMLPRQQCPVKTLTKRCEAFEQNRMTNHWCYTDNFMVNPVNVFRAVRYPSEPVPVSEWVRTHPDIRRLIGYQ